MVSRIAWPLEDGGESKKQKITFKDKQMNAYVIHINATWYIKMETYGIETPIKKVLTLHKLLIAPKI